MAELVADMLTHFRSPCADGFLKHHHVAVRGVSESFRARPQITRRAAFKTNRRDCPHRVLGQLSRRLGPGLAGPLIAVLEIVGKFPQDFNL